MICKHCNSEVRKGANFCTVCGYKMEGNEASTTTSSTSVEGKGLAVASIVLGVLSIVTGFFIIIFPIIGLILGLCQKDKCTEKKIGVILNSIALAISVLVIVVISVAIVGFSKLWDSDELFDRIKTEFVDEKVYGDVGSRLSDWNVYEDQRQDNLSYDKSFEGVWRKLGVGNSYYILDDGKFYYYRDINDKEDNYTIGEYEEGLLTDYEDLDMELVKNTIDANINVSSLNDFHYIKFHPTKDVNKGIELEPEDYEKLIIIIDHDMDGIEAQFVDIDDGYDCFVKLNDIENANM